MLEDNATDAELVKHILRQAGVTFSMKRVETEEDYTRELAENPPNLILSDYALPGFDGYAALEIAKKMQQDVPFIFVTGTMGEEVAIETLKNGATDYVLKTRLNRLIPATQRALREAAERSERRRAEAQLRESHEQLRALSVYLQHVREEERTRIAREVHDELGQALTSCKLDLSWVAGRLPEDLKPLVEKTRALITHIDSTIQTVRRIATELRPGVLDHLGLAAALEWQANEFQTRTGIKCEVHSSARDTARPGIEHHVFPHLPGDVDQYHPPCRSHPCERPFERRCRAAYLGSGRQRPRHFASGDFRSAFNGPARHA